MRNPRLCECLLSQRNVSTSHDYLTSQCKPFCEVLWKKFSLSEGFLEGKLQIVYVIPGKIIITLKAYPLGYECVAERILEDLSRNSNYHKLVVVVLHSCITKNVPALNHVHPLGSISPAFHASWSFMFLRHLRTPANDYFHNHSSVWQTTCDIQSRREKINLWIKQ